jgi:hypothetical protein
MVVANFGLSGAVSPNSSRAICGWQQAGNSLAVICPNQPGFCCERFMDELSADFSMVTLASHGAGLATE